MYKFKLNVIFKITLAALFCALGIICTKLLAIQNIAGIPYIRVSLGPTIYLLSGLVLGPIYGGLVGFLGDVIGFFMFDSSGYGYNPLLSISYFLYGFLAGLLVYLLRHNKKITFPYIQLGLMVAMVATLVSFLFTHTEIVLYKHVYELTDTLRISLTIMIGVLFSIYFTVYYLTFRTLKNQDKKVLLNNLSTIILAVFFVTQLFVGGTIKAFMFEVNFLFLFAAQLIATIIEISLGTYVCVVLYYLLSRQLSKYIVIENKN